MSLGATRGWFPAVSLLALFVAGCGGPFLIFPGGELSGEVVRESVADWSFARDSVIALETRPDDPYSVELNSIVKQGGLYLDPAEGRTWLEYIRADPRVRVRVGERIYPLVAVLADRPGELEGFEADRFVYRLDPRSE